MDEMFIRKISNERQNRVILQFATDAQQRFLL